MLLTIDVGNTHTTFGVFHSEKLLADWRVSTSSRRTSDEWGYILKELIADQGIEEKNINQVAISCVVPPVLNNLRELFEKKWINVLMVIGPGVRTGLSIRAEPKETGADRIVNAVAAAHIYGGDLVIIDFGTATTFCAINANREYLGGSIAPGIGISQEALYEKTARLPRIDVEIPDKCIGRNTVEAMHSGIFYGYIGLCREIVINMKKEFALKARVVATGGWGIFLHNYCDFIDFFNPTLTLEGLRIINELNQKS
ncbi:MAG TPA: type III pantothenate kinase [Candidatus Atribacteria bacterium]|nr:type III pantothenate kinase [Candidatus Atribacteria bacterium]